MRPSGQEICSRALEFGEERKDAHYEMGEKQGDAAKQNKRVGREGTKAAH